MRSTRPVWTPYRECPLPDQFCLQHLPVVDPGQRDADTDEHLAHSLQIFQLRELATLDAFVCPDYLVVFGIGAAASFTLIGMALAPLLESAGAFLALYALFRAGTLPVRLVRQ
jgi:hypothetical protein